MAASKLLKRIRLEARRSLEARERYTEQQLKQVTDSLETAQREVVALVKGMGRAGSLRPGDELKLGGLRELRKEIDAVTSQLAKVVRLRVVTGLKGSFDGGIKSTITELVKAAAPDWGKMGKDGLERTYSAAFAVVDRQALDFMTGYTLQLAGSVPVELGNKIKTGVLQGIATGLGPDEIVKRLGKVVRDKEDFRNAGGRVFPSAQARLDAIVRTELTRAHSQGRNKMFGEVGLQVVTWETVGDERVCPTCDALQGKRFKLDPAMKGDLEVLPDMPLHTLCRCMTFADEPEKAEPPERVWRKALEKRRRAQPPTDAKYAPVPSTFETAQAAADWLVEKGHVKAAILPGLVSPGSGQEIVQAIARTMDDYPVLRGELTAVGTAGKMKELLDAVNRAKAVQAGAKSETEIAAWVAARAAETAAAQESARELGKNTLAWFAQRSRVLGISGANFRDNVIAELGAANEASGWSIQGSAKNPVRWTVNHELGHLVHTVISQDAQKKLQGIYESAAVSIRKDISRYATTSWQEMAAEAWSQFRTAPETMSETAKKIAGVMDKALREMEKGRSR